jgi:hypothetical protein
MKTIKHSMIIALCSVMICSCSQRSDAPSHLVAVPKNATLVLALNAEQVVEKAGLNDLEQYKFYSLLKKELENKSPEESKLAKNFLKDTRTSGLNLDNIFVYLLANDNKDDDVSYGVTFLIDDLKTFEKFLKTSGLGADDNIESRKIKSLFVLEGATVQWNDKIAVVSSRDIAGNGVEVFNEDESQSILANDLFKSEYSGKDDAYLFFEYNNFIGGILKNSPYYARYTDTSALSSVFDLYKDLSLSLTWNAEKGEFVVAGKMLPAEKATELFEKFYKTDFDSNLYRYFPDKSLMALKFGIKPLDIYNEYKKYFSNIAGYDREMKTFMERYDAKITSVLSNFTGDLLGSLIGFNAGSIPDFAVAVGVNEGKENEVIALMKELGFVKNPEGYYLLQSGGVNLYFAVNNKAAYLTDDKTHITDFLDNTHYTSDITAAKDFGEELENAGNYFYWDMNINHYPAMLKGVLAMLSQGNMAMPLLEALKSINIRTIDINSSEFKIKFTGDDYASKILLKEVDKLASQYLN